MAPERVEEPNRRDVERQIFDMRREKAKIEDTIRRMQAAQQRIFQDRKLEADDRPTGEAEVEHKRKREDEEDKSPVKKKEKRIKVGSDDEDKDDEKDEEKDEAKDDAKEGLDGKVKEEAEEKKEEDDDDKEKDSKRRPDRSGRPNKTDPRSRNLFGKLLGHLHSAKAKLDTEKNAKHMELRQKASQRLEEKLSMSKMNIKEFRKHTFEQQIVEEAKKAMDIEKAIAEKELLLLQRRLENHYSLMMNFIKTEAQPTIFYLPMKHSKDTEQKLEDTRAAIKMKISSLKVQLQQTETTEDPEDAMRRYAAEAAAAAPLPQATKERDGGDAEVDDDDDLESQPGSKKKRRAEEDGDKKKLDEKNHEESKDDEEEKHGKKNGKEEHKDDDKKPDSDSDNEQ